MTMTLSSATAAAQAAKADITAPVVANNTGVAGSAGNSSRNNGGADQSASSANSANSNANNSNNSNNSKTASQNSKPATSSQSGSQPVSSRNEASAQLATQAADAVAAATPLFAQMLTLADAAKGDASDESSDHSDTDLSGAGSAAAGNVLPAMVSSMLNLAPAPATSDSAASGNASDAVSAVATLSSSATRLNLAAANVAVNPASQLAEEAAAAQVTAAQAGTPQNVFSLANNASLATAAARQLQAAAPATDSAERQPAAEPVAEADSDAAAIPAALPAAVRVASRSADNSIASSASAAPQPAAAATLVVKDDSARNLGNTGTSSTVTNVNVAQSATPASTDASAASVKLAGSPDQWQQPLRDALGDRLQLQLQRNSEQAVIRLEPPNMGSIEISIRHSAGALTVNLSASNSDVVRQLNTISDGVRQDLSSRQFSDVAVTVSSSRAQSQADQGGRNGQQREQNDGRTPGRALSDDDSTATFAMTGE